MGKVCDLIANNHTQFTEEDRPWMKELADEQLDLMVPVNIPEKEADPTVNSLEEAIELIPEEFQADVKQALVTNETYRKGFIDTIVANEDAGFTADELTDMPAEQLEKLAKLARKEEPTANEGKDFSGNSGAPTTTPPKVVPMELPTINWEK